jgi:hypothetical protein
LTTLNPKHFNKRQAVEDVVTQLTEGPLKALT